ncbi:MAG: DUF5110 domain-containing protein [Asgard group archaeon]|nr:DUF5110 domain-containing protein [Asgard group archaeon]
MPGFVQNLKDFIASKIALPLFRSIGKLLNTKIIPFRWITLGGVQKVTTNGDIAIFQFANGYLEIKVITESIWRIRASKSPLQKDHYSWAASPIETPFNLKVNLDLGYYVIKVDKNISQKNDLLIKINENNGAILFEKMDGEVLSQDIKAISWSKRKRWAATHKKATVNELQIGFGERTGSLAKNGRKMIFWNTDPRIYHKTNDPLYQSEPIQISVRENGSAYGIFYDNHHYSLIKIDKKKQSKVSYFTEQEPICYYFFSGPSLKDVIQQLTLINGRISLPPRWILGHQQCRWSYYPEEQVRAIASTFRDKQIPCDCIHLDIDYMDGYRSFTWNKERFPNPKKLIDDLHLEGFNIVVNTDPGLKIDTNWNIYNEGVKNNYFCKLPNGKLYTSKVWPGKCVFPDFIKHEVRTWWGSLFNSLVEVGVDGFWLDMNEPVTFTIKGTFPNKVQHHMIDKDVSHREAHNIYGLNMARATRQGIDSLRPNIRNFIFTRSCYASIQKYAASWTGDNYSDWIGLQQSLPMIINMGLCGQSIVAADIGGFYQNCTPELLTRWYQLGIFYPMCRNHSSAGTVSQEPWAFGEEIEQIVKKYIELRYQLTPYLYYYTWEASRTGLPIMRPLFMEFPNDIEAYNKKWFDTEFMFGERILIAPILNKMPNDNSSAKREIYLPQGTWIDFWSKEILKGGTVIEKEFSLDQLAIFVKAGSIIPTNPVVQFLEQTKDHPVIFEIYPGIEFQGKAYFDDGISKDYLQNNYCSLNLQGIKKSNELTIDIFKEGKLEELSTTNKNIHFVFHRVNKPLIIRLNDKKYSEGFDLGNNSWNYDDNTKMLIIKTNNYEFPLSIQLLF